MPITPPRASTSFTRCDLPGPPTAGLHGIAPIVSKLTASNSVLQPSFAAACAASQPACPPPITNTSYLNASRAPLLSKAFAHYLNWLFYSIDRQGGPVAFS